MTLASLEARARPRGATHASRAPRTRAQRGDVATSRGRRPRAPRLRASVDEERSERADSADGASTSGKRPTMELQMTPASGVPFAGSRVVDFVAAWDAISPRLAAREHGEVDKEMLLSALTLAIPRLQQIVRMDAKGRKPAHERAVDVTLTAGGLGNGRGVHLRRIASRGRRARNGEFR